MPRNPSELQRLTEEVAYWKAQLREGIHSKSTKEYIFAQLRAAARPLGIDVPDYNSGGFSAFLLEESE